MKTIGGKNNSKKYTLSSVIGQGSFGKVYLSSPFAVKEMTLNVEPYLKTALMNEITILQKLNHPNIVALHEVVYQGNFVYLVMEYCEMDLSKYLKKYKIDQKSAIYIFKQMLSGFSKLVEKGIIHRDLKPANILVNAKNQFKLADFGLAKYVDHYDSKLLQTIAGTPLYMAPQLLKKTNYTTKCDVWSIGVMFYQLLTGKLPWCANSEKELYLNIINKPLNLPSMLSDWTKDLLQKMLVVNQTQRIGWEDLFKAVIRKQPQDRNQSKNKEKQRANSSAKSQKSIQSIPALKKNEQSNQFKIQQLRDIFQLELSQYFDTETAKRIASDSKYSLKGEDAEKLKKVLDLFCPEFQNIFSRKN